MIYPLQPVPTVFTLPIVAKDCGTCLGQGSVWLTCPSCNGNRCANCAQMGRIWVRCAACRGSGTQRLTADEVRALMMR